MAVKNDDAAPNPTLFLREKQVEKWLQKRDSSIIENLEKGFGGGPADDAWVALFPIDYQVELEEKNSDFRIFLNAAKGSLLTLRENEFQQPTLARKFCLWIEYLRDAMVSNAKTTIGEKANEEQDGDGPADDGGSNETNPETATKKMTLVEVEMEARRLVNVKDMERFTMTLIPRDPQEEEDLINLLTSTRSVNEKKKYLSVSLTVCLAGAKAVQPLAFAVDEDNMVNPIEFRSVLIRLGLSEKGIGEQIEDIVKGLNKIGNVRLRKLGSTVLQVADLSRETTQGRRYYHEGLVDLSGTEDLSFDGSPDKSRAVVVAGESGSGKTTFGRYGVKQLITSELDSPRTGVIYISFPPSAGKEMEKIPDNSNDSDLVLRMLFAMCLRNFFDRSKQDPVEDAAYRLVSKLATNMSEARNKGARSIYDDAIDGFFVRSRKEHVECRAWWGELLPGVELDGLVIVLDEVGRSRRLARGLVDVSRDIATEVVVSQRAKKCKIVLCGTGLDEVDENFQELTDITDPAKAKVVVAKRVNFSSTAFTRVLESRKIKEEEILQGTISSALAENTRMLMEAIVPTMECEPLTECYQGPFKESLRTEHRIAAGSSGFLMNYASRVFIERNGLKDIGERKKLEQIFQDAFVFFLREAVKDILQEDADEKYLVGTARKSLLEELAHKEIDEQIFFFGIANRDEPTSRAMRFLSCLGSSFAVPDGDGLLFEKAVSLHIARLSTSLGRKQIGSYKLQSGVPDGQRNYKVSKLQEEAKAIRSMFPNSLDGIRDECPLSLVLTQGLSIAAGPDTMELQLSLNDNGKVIGCLDIYQHKFLKNGHEFEKLMKAVIPLGRSREDLGFSAKSETEVRKAGKVRKCLDKFVKVLGEEFGITLSIRKRVIVIKASAKDLKNSERTVFQGGVTVWTREFLEPTCSLFSPGDIE